MEITADTLVADIPAHHPRRIEVFERLQARAQGGDGATGSAR